MASHKYTWLCIYQGNFRTCKHLENAIFEQCGAQKCMECGNFTCATHLLVREEKVQI